MPSEDSSPDDRCKTCGHRADEHWAGGLCGWRARRLWTTEGCICSAFVPAKPETVGERECDPEDDEPAPCKTCGEPWHKRHVCNPEPECETGDMRTCTTACPVHGVPEPEGNGCPYCTGSTNPDLRDHVLNVHPDEFANWAAGPEPEAPKCPEVAIAGEHCRYENGGPCCFCGTQPEPETPAPPRPPYAVAYATGSGALNEIALPGDATVAVVDSTLVISHAAGVLGIAHVKPYELEN